jgi:hypothetical protein
MYSSWPCTACCGRTATSRETAAQHVVRYMQARVLSVGMLKLLRLLLTWSTGQSVNVWQTKIGG